MNPLFVFLVILIAIFAWFLLASLFSPLGALFKALFDDVKKAINKDDKEGEN